MSWRNAIGKINLPEDELKLLLIITVQVPLGYLFSFLKSSWKVSFIAQKIYLMSFGVIGVIYLFGLINIFLIFPFTLLFYSMTNLCSCPRSTLAVSSLALGYLSFFHVYRYFTDYDSNSNSSINVLMMQVPRIIYYNWHSYQQKKSKETSKACSGSFFDYFCYIFCFLGLFTGPVYSYNEYMNLFASKEVSSTDRKYFRSLILNFVTVSGLYVVILATFPPFAWILTDEFYQKNMVYRALIITVHLLLARLKYYIAWILADISSGLAQLRDEDSKYNQFVRSINVKGVELSCSTKSRIDNWNITIAKWLRRCFYEPFNLNLKISKEIASLLVFIISAFWHGFYPAYYISFILFYISLRTERFFFKSKLRNYLPQFLYHLQMDVAGCSFKFYAWKDTKAYLWNNFDILALSLGLFFSGALSSRFFPPS